MLEKVLSEKKINNEKIFIPYMMAGDGGLDTLKERIQFLASCGATAIEVGIPFSDPVADGPVIQAAGLRSLSEGTTLQSVLTTIANIERNVKIPLIIMSYLNPILAYGIEKFVEDAQNAGISGLIIPDLPIEEERIMQPYLDHSSLIMIRLATLTSPGERLHEIIATAKGFIYAVSVTGTTGTVENFSKELGTFLKELHENSPIPVVAGFGISTLEQVRELSSYCDGVIVGSKIVELFHLEKVDEIQKLMQCIK